MTKSGRKAMGINSRVIKRMQQRGTRGNIIKSLAELIKNSDLAMYKIKKSGKNGFIFFDEIDRL